MTPPIDRRTLRPNRPTRSRAWRAGALVGAALLSGCAATTTFTVTPSPQAPVCRPEASLGPVPVFWAPRWRADQKDVAAREAAAAAGLARFFGRPDCYAAARVQRVADADAAAAQAAAAAGSDPAATALTVVVRELGPVLKLGASAALVEGGTEVVLDLAVFTRGDTAASARRYTTHWRHGGPGVIKGVASLPEDMAAALAASLQPPAP